MGLRKLFKAKELDDKQATALLEKNGIPIKDKSNYDRKKYKFGEFDKYTQENVKLRDNTLRPVLPNVNTGYGSYDTSDNQHEANQGYGYDEYASDFQNKNSSNNDNGYSGGYSSEYGMRGSTYATQTRSERTGAANVQRRPKVSNNNNSNSYRTETTDRKGRTADTMSVTPSNGYGYEPSINNYQPSGGNGGGYGYDPYSDVASSITGNPTTLSKTTTKATYDPYAPGEEPYAADNNGYGDDIYGAYAVRDDDDNDNDNDVDTITGTGNGNADADGLSGGMQALQLQEEEEKQRTHDDAGFDPYGPAATAGTAVETMSTIGRTGVADDMDLNAYEPTQAQTQPYDGDEFEEEVDEDEEELNRIQRQTKDVREDTVNLSRTLVDNLGQANYTATNTLGVLGNQREKIYEMENNLGTMKVQQRFVDDHVKQLEHYNRSLFHIKVNNPFTRNSRRRAKDQEFLAQRQQDRANKDQLNSNLYRSQRAIMEQMKDDGNKSELQEKYDYERRVREASKYLTKDHDEEDERMEVEIAANVEHAQKLAENLKKKAQLMNSEIQQQNDDLRTVSENVDHMDDKLVMTTRRIRGI